ncbi:MAG TPA: hypothetical protein VFD82_05270 [Planctomycetota bacterium]|nr:hypothetical protein [Planctomycetota bacterium]
MRPISALCLFTPLAALTPLAAQVGYSTGFETFVASSSGTPCAGQDGFYVPPVAGSVDGAIFDYPTNTIGVPINPNGGLNFYAGVVVSGSCRAQRNVTPPTNARCVVQFDVLCNYVGTAAAPPNNIGGVSFQPSAAIPPQFPVVAVYMNLLARWPAGAMTPPPTWDADTAFGPTPASVITTLPDPAFQGLAVNVWHTWGATLDLRTQEYINWRITNGLTGITTVYTPPAPVPLPNQGSLQMPTDFRFFTGSLGNLFAVDNFTVTFGATYDTFGTGCPGALGVPAIAVTPGFMPTLGFGLSVDFSNLPLGIGLMMTGLSNTLFGGAVPLPLPLAGFGFPGCDLLVDPMVMTTVVGPGTTATWSLPIPPTLALAGFELFNQGASLDTGPAFLAFSNGGRAVLGL